MMTYPNGCQPPWDRDRSCLIYRFYNSETMVIKHTCYLPSGEVVTSTNANVDFILRDQRFATTEMWHGDLDDGIEFVDEEEFPGLIKITIPENISTGLRRGSYIFSIQVIDKDTLERKIAMEGMIIIEYATTSDTRDIPYRDADWTGE